MPDFKEVTSAFPTTIWDGSSTTRTGDEVLFRNPPDGFDRIQMVAEIARVQEVVKYVATVSNIYLGPPILSNVSPFMEGLAVTWLPLGSPNRYTAPRVDWGDGGPEENFLFFGNPNTHTYAAAGMYTITVRDTNIFGTTVIQWTVEAVEV